MARIMLLDLPSCQRNVLIRCYSSLALQREQYLREKKMGSDAYRKALDAQVNYSIIFTRCLHSLKKCSKDEVKLINKKFTAQWSLP